MGLYPFQYTPFLGLEREDNARRLQFYRIILNVDIEDVSSLKISNLWNNESQFSRKGTTDFS